MRVSVIGFTDRGEALAKRIQELTALSEYDIRLWTKQEAMPLTDWAASEFAVHHALVFIGACGIAVRAIAPSVRDKLTDSPVLVIDEYGQYVIPILSGHVGGANELAQELAGALDAVPVITTATDLNDIFAVDVFARKNGLQIINRKGIAAVSATLLRGEQAIVPIEGEGCLVLRPRYYVLGVGCRRGKSWEELRDFLEEIMTEADIRLDELYAVASIDRKADEPGIVQLADRLGVPYLTYSSEELAALDGTYAASPFVEETVGVDNVCERAAMAVCTYEAHCAGGELVVGKRARDGMTMAIARRAWQPR